MWKSVKRNRNDSPFHLPVVTGIGICSIPWSHLSLWVHLCALFSGNKMGVRLYTLLCILLLDSFKGFPNVYRKRNPSLVHMQSLRDCFQHAFLALCQLSSTARCVEPFGTSCAPSLVVLLLT